MKDEEHAFIIRLIMCIKKRRSLNITEFWLLLGILVLYSSYPLTVSFSLLTRIIRQVLTYLLITSWLSLV